MIRRHNTSAMLMHWFNALSWLFLLSTGFALLAPGVQPVGNWWHSLWSGLLGETGLFRAHIYAGCLWLGVYCLYTAVFLRKDVIPFLREIFDLSLKSDAIWCLRKTLWLVLGASRMSKLGIPPQLPPQGFYNAGQKLIAVAAVLCGVTLVGTGLLLYASASLQGWETVVQWALLLHLCCAGLMAILLPVHIYMAAFAPGERPALMSMFTGVVPASFARHHNPLWYARVKAEGEAGRPD